LIIKINSRHIEKIRINRNREPKDIAKISIKKLMLLPPSICYNPAPYIYRQPD
jgi:hypothetical protein